MINYTDFDLLIFAKTIFAQKKFFDLANFCRTSLMYKCWQNDITTEKLNDINITDNEFALATR
ncbi:MAG: hypothetical protein LBU68_00330, partial [Rickettsiales bacterium]|nr:hypothetical protein [Rickettsiales bacterium]